MLSLLWAASFVGLSSAVSSRSALSIIDGEIVTDPLEHHSFFALLANGNKWAGCGASIINATHGLSAAHCFGRGADPCSTRTVDVWVGAVTLMPDGTINNDIESKKIPALVKCHPSFNGTCSQGHDVAVLELQGSLPNFVVPVSVDVQSEVTPGSLITSMGFGVTEVVDAEGRTVDPEVIGVPSHQLRQVHLEVLDQDDHGCAAVYDHGYGCSDEASEGAAQHKDQQFCAGDDAHSGKDSCAGDSGSPVVVGASDGTMVQIGVVSYGGGPGGDSGNDRACGSRDWPGVYSKVSSFRSWLEGT